MLGRIRGPQRTVNFARVIDTMEVNSMTQVQNDVFRHLAPWRQKLLRLLKEATSAPDRPPQESDDGDHAEPERSESEARRTRAGRNKKPI